MLLVVLLISGAGCSTVPSENRAETNDRAAFWVDTLRSEPVEFEVLLDDLGEVQVIYLGEYHSIPGHQELQLAVLEGLADRGVPLALGFEQFEEPAQDALDRFNDGSLDLTQLIDETDWPERWRGYTNYLDLMKAARAHEIPVIALNARAETIRAVGRKGLAGLTPEQRAELPETIDAADPAYQKLLKQLLGLHMAFDPEKLQTVIEAQAARDETMAERLTEFLNSTEGQGRTVVVICGRGHCEFGLGVPSRLERRWPDATQRIVLFSESGDLELTEAERAQMREIEVTHEFLRSLGRSQADYIRVTEPATGSN